MLSTNTRARKAPESSRFWIAIYTAMADIKALIINKANRMLLNSLPLLLVSVGIGVRIHYRQSTYIVVTFGSRLSR